MMQVVLECDAERPLGFGDRILESPGTCRGGAQGRTRLRDDLVRLELFRGEECFAAELRGLLVVARSEREPTQGLEDTEPFDRSPAF